MTFIVGSRLGGAISGLAAALLLAVHPFFALHAFFVEMEVPMVFMLLLGLWSVLEGERSRRIAWFVAAGISFAVAALFKEVALPFIFCCAVYSALRFVRHDYRMALRVFWSVFSPALVGLVVWALWAWRLSPTVFVAAMNRWVRSMSSVNLLDPRARIGAGQWADQLVYHFLGPAFVVGLVVGLVVFLGRRRWRADRFTVLLWGYVLWAVGFSFLVRLKEPRHLIAVLPIAALLIGSGVDWQRAVLRVWQHGHLYARLLLALALGGFVLSASPLRLPSGPLTHLNSWLDSGYGGRLLENDRFYNVLRLAGVYLREHSEPGEVITVAHQATVTAYYADRHYQMLYTANRATISRMLDGARYLVWDAPIFLALTPTEVDVLQEEIRVRFRSERIIQDGPRTVTIYRR